MKFAAVALLIVAAPVVAAAQPGVTSPAKPPPPGTLPAPVPPTITPPAPAPGTPGAPDWLPGVTDVIDAGTADGKVILTLDKALQIAQQVQPSLRQARAQLEAAAGRVDLAKVAQHPTVTVAAIASTGSKAQRDTQVNTMGMTVPGSGGFFTIDGGLALTASASWRLYDFGLTHANIAAADANAAAQAAAIDVNVLDVRKSVESAYLEAVARARLVRVAQATVTSEEGHLDQAKRFVAAQAHDPIEVAQAQARAATARSALAQAQSNQAIAVANLRAAIGWVELQQSLGVDQNWPTPPAEDPQSLGDLVTVARQHRPEIAQFDRELASADASLTVAHAEHRPVITANASTQWQPDTDDGDPQPIWQASVQLSWGIFDGGKSAADIRIANANIQSTAAQRDALLVSITSQLDSARSQIVANRANVQASGEAVTAARAQLQLAEARYTQGLGSQIELADAQTAVTTAEGNLVSAEWQLADAWAQLRRAIGEG